MVIFSGGPEGFWSVRVHAQKQPHIINTNAASANRIRKRCLWGGTVFSAIVFEFPFCGWFFVETHCMRLDFACVSVLIECVSIGVSTGTILQNNYSMKMVRHYNPFVQVNVLSQFGCVLPFFCDNQSLWRKGHLPIANITEQTTSIKCTNRNKIIAGSAIIPCGQACCLHSVFVFVESHMSLRRDALHASRF